MTKSKTKELSDEQRTQLESDVIQEIQDRIGEILQKEFGHVTPTLYFKCVGNLLMWLVMDFIDRMFKNRYFEGKLDFIDDFARSCKVMLSTREKERQGKFDD